jgi:hypothetical protein
MSKRQTWTIATALGDVCVIETRSEDSGRIDAVLWVPQSSPVHKRHLREDMLQQAVGEYLSEYTVDDYGTTIASISQTQEKAYLTRRA